MLGDDDKAPFIVGGEHIIFEKEYVGNNIPNDFMVYNQNTGLGANAKIQATGIIKGDSIIREPDRFGIGQYLNVGRVDWSPTTNGQVGYGGYSLWWNPELVPSQGKFEVNTFYGISVPPTIVNPSDDVISLVEEPYSIETQVGANRGENFKIELSNVKTEKLFSLPINLST